MQGQVNATDEVLKCFQVFSNKNEKNAFISHKCHTLLGSPFVVEDFMAIVLEHWLWHIEMHFLLHGIYWIQWVESLPYYNHCFT